MLAPDAGSILARVHSEQGGASRTTITPERCCVPDQRSPTALTRARLDRRDEHGSVVRLCPRADSERQLSGSSSEASPRSLAPSSCRLTLCGLAGHRAARRRGLADYRCLNACVACRACPRLYCTSLQHNWEAVLPPPQTLPIPEPLLTCAKLTQAPKARPVTFSVRQLRRRILPARTWCFHGLELSSCEDRHDEGNHPPTGLALLYTVHNTSN